jgi:glycosyltransferase involved in cell wall biosynthesis
VVVALIEGLAALGHRVSLLAPRGTRVPAATHVEVPAAVLLGREGDVRNHLPTGAEILHAHFVVPRLPAGVAFVQTLHGNLAAGDPMPPNTVFLSRNHAQRHGATTFVYNGLNPTDFTFRAQKEDYDLFIGRLHSVKGYRWAIEGAKRTGRRLIVAGGWRPSLRRRIRYAGVVDGARKRELLAGARCLWMPALWDEPFGLTLIEAMFSGTPVVGTRRGALPEIVTPEVGALGDTLDELIEGSRTIESRSPAACRAHAERYFSHIAMAEQYVRLYRSLLATGALVPGQAVPYTTT